MDKGNDVDVRSWEEWLAVAFSCVCYLCIASVRVDVFLACFVLPTLSFAWWSVRDYRAAAAESKATCMRTLALLRETMEVGHSTHEQRSNRGNAT